MRRLGSILMVVLGLASCSIGTVDEPSHETQGELTVTLKQDRSLAAVKATEELPEVDDFIVEVYETATDRLFFRKTYADAQGMKIPLNIGEHRLYAYYGDPQKAGFNACCYIADTLFTVLPQQLVEVEAVARRANVKVAVAFGESLQFDYTQYYAEVVSSDKAELTFVKTEKRAGYLPAGDLSLNLYVYVQDKWMVYRTSPVTCEAGDFITFNVDTQSFGDLSVEIVIDNGVDTVVKDITVPAEAAPLEGPSLTVSGFEGNRFSTVEADSREHAGYKADIVAMGGISSCVLEINSSYLGSLGLPSSVDLASMDARTEELLNSVGIKALRNMAGSRLAYVDFSGLINHISHNVPYTPENGQSCADVKIVVTDSNGRTASSDTYTFAVEKSKASISWKDYDVWATKMVAPTLAVQTGDPSLYVLRYAKSSDMSGSSVRTIYPSSVSGKTLTFPTITGLDPGTSYRIWAEYNGNSQNTTDQYSFNTESAWQMPNSDFEEWTELKHTFERTWASSVDYYWHRPYSWTKCWDVNAKISMPSSGLAATSPNVKCFPCAGRSTDRYSGSYSAMIFVVNVGTWNTDNTAVETSYIGELFVGSASDNGTPSYGTVSCPSRPTALKFHYKYSPKGSCLFSADVTLSGGGATLASGSVTGGAASSWTEMTIPLTYESDNVKATDIAVSFKSATTDAGVNVKTTIEYNGGTYTAHVGSQLRIDNIRLIYE